jgi:enoyl-CoA hydratase/carnithine racemase
MTDTVRVITEGAVRQLRIDRPLKKNALDQATYDALASGLRSALDDDAIRVIVLTGGPEVFTAGNDLADFARIATARAGAGTATKESGAPEASAPIDGRLPASAFLETLVAAPKPVVAAVAGWAVGIGTTLLLHCDFVFAAPSARFKTPFVDLGLCPEAGSSVLLPAAIGPRRAAEMLYLGAEVDAERALAWGLVHEVVADPIARAMERAAELAAKPPQALRVAKELVRKPVRAAMVQAMYDERDAFEERLTSQEAKEAVLRQLAGRASARR